MYRKRFVVGETFVAIFNEFYSFLLKRDYAPSTAHTYAQIGISSWERGAQHLGDLAAFTQDTGSTARVRNRGFGLFLDWVTEKQVPVPFPSEVKAARELLLSQLGEDSPQVSESRGWANFRFWLSKEYRVKNVNTFMGCLNDLFIDNPSQEVIFQRMIDSKQPYKLVKESYQLYLKYCKELNLDRIDPWKIDWTKRTAAVFRRITANYRAAPRNVDQKRELDRIAHLQWSAYTSEANIYGGRTWTVEGQMFPSDIIEEYQKLFPFGPLSDMPGYDVPILREQLEIWLEETHKIMQG